MVAAARYEIVLTQSVLAWQGAFLLSHAIERARSLLVTVHSYRPDGDLVTQGGPMWYRSAQLDADFHYLSPTDAGAVVVMPPLTHDEGATRLEVVVRPFGTPTRPVPEIVSTFCFLDLDPVDAPGPVVISTHSPEAVDV